MEIYMCAFDNMKSSNRKETPFSEAEIVSVMFLIASEEGEIIDYSFYNEEHLFVCIFIIQSGASHLKERWSNVSEPLL